MSGHNWRPSSVHFLAKVGQKEPPKFKKMKKKKLRMLALKAKQKFKVKCLF